MWFYPPDARREKVWDAAHAAPSFGTQQARSMLDMMVHGSKYAISKAGIDPSTLVVGETGWPTAGWAHATVDNARIFHENCMSGRMFSPCNAEVPVVLFEFMDESLKPGNADESFWGQLSGSLQPKW